MSRVLSPLAEDMLTDIPPFLRDSHEYRAIFQAYARKLEQLEADLERVRRNLIVWTADDLGLPWWETLVEIEVNPPGFTTEQRRQAVIAELQGLLEAGSGLSWEDAITFLAGPDWSYQEHDPWNPDSPDPYTIRVTLPFPPTADTYQRIRRLAAKRTPTHIRLEFAFSGGFVLDQSQLDLEPLS